jgi:predicted phosphoribosyltransferase
VAHRHGQALDSVFLFDNRRDGGTVLSRELARVLHGDEVVVALGPRGMPAAAVVAEAFGLPLDVVALAKVRHPGHPEYTLGAVAPAGDAAVPQRTKGLEPAQVADAIALARAEAVELHGRLHRTRTEADLSGRIAVLVDDGVATGSTMRAAARWARSRGARSVIGTAPIGAHATVASLVGEVDEVICPYAVDDLVAIGLWYETYGRVDDDEVEALFVEASLGAPIR